MSEASTPSAPYLSVVVTARNDDHGGNPLYRTHLFLDCLLQQCDRHGVDAELILVEWNPPADRPRLAEVLRWPAQEGCCRVRIIEVPPEVHARFEFADRLPLFQMIAKNVGIRRARGRFILATNIDILLSDGVMAIIAERRLRQKFVYRVDRLDVPAEIDPAWPLDEQLAWCARSVIRVNGPTGTLDLRTGVFDRIYPEPSWLFKLFEPLLDRFPKLRERLPNGRLLRRIESRGRRLRASWRRFRRMLWNVYAIAYWLIAGLRQPWLLPKRARRRVAQLLAALDGGATDASGRTFATGLAEAPVGLLFLVLAAIRKLWAASARERILDESRIALHTNASGDFTLLSAEGWLAVDGYLEFEMYSMHIDGLVLLQAHYAGYRQQTLKVPVYHIEHGGGHRPEAKGGESLAADLERRRIPQLSDADLYAYYRQMMDANAPLSFNPANWGLLDTELPETRVYNNNPVPSSISQEP